jgi:hypothetical protein
MTSDFYFLVIAVHIIFKMFLLVYDSCTGGYIVIFIGMYTYVYMYISLVLFIPSIILPLSPHPFLK